ncbi:MAG: bifunctional oligoribonuclease/PAP phosphatase NrnA [Lentisphaerae bacterium]|nr:bifunctional oligoribonuclease/PAP phosphatase NrnA [Lentisphaerota bacterium]
MNKVFQEIVSKLLSASRVLIMTHRRPDGDALGSSFGLREFLRSRNIAADVLVPDPLPRRYSNFCTGYLTCSDAKMIDGYDLFAAVDCANGERLGSGDALTIEMLRKRNFISIDHHKGNSLAAPCEWIEPTACSASFMVAKLLLSTGLEIDSAAATYLMTGIMTDTGSFCFANTDAAAFEIAAKLRERGADIDRIANTVFFSKPINQLRFEAELINNCFKLCCNGRFAYCFVPEELMKKHNFDMREDEGLIDLLRGIEGVVIAMLCHKRVDGFRVSLRSKDQKFPVGPIARELGGGGHDMAAGTTLDLPEFADVEKLMTEKVSALLN